MNIVQGRIDVHHHLIPPAFARTMDRKGIHEVAGAPLPNWTPEASLSVMDAIGTQTTLLSLSAPGVYLGDLQEACDLARQCNTYAAEVKQKYSGRFGFFAVLPMPFTDQSCREAAYALDTLNADGVVLLGSTEGIFLGDARLDELMNELNRRKTIVFVHPNLHKTSQELGLSMPGFLMEFLCDTTRAALNLILSGTQERYPDIRWILAHAGGFLPYIAWRASLANFMPEFSDKAPQGILHYIRRFYFDTALSPSPYAMSALNELVGEKQILFGSDFPFAPSLASSLQAKMLDSLEFWNCAQHYQINRGNAIALFPQYAKPDESVSAPPTYASESILQRIGRMARQPVISLAENLRKR